MSLREQTTNTPLTGQKIPGLHHATALPTAPQNSPANGTAKAAAGPWFNCSERDVLWTEYALDEAGGAWVWTLSIGVLGDPARTSRLTVDTPFMGLLGNETTSWKEPAYR